MSFLPNFEFGILYFDFLLHKSIDDWKRYFSNQPPTPYSDGKNLFTKTFSTGSFFITDCKFGDMKTTCIKVESEGMAYLGVSETEFNQCSSYEGSPCTYFESGSFFQYRVKGINRTITPGVSNGIQTGIIARENSQDLNTVEETSASGHHSETAGSVLCNWYGNISYISVNVSKCKSLFNVGYLIFNDASGISRTKFCYFTSNEASEICHWHLHSQHFISCSNYLNSSYTSPNATDPGFFNLGFSNASLSISNSVIKDNSGKALLYSNPDNCSIIVDRCHLDNPKIEKVAYSQGNIQFMNKNFIYILNVPYKNCIFTDIKYKTIYVNKLCRCDSNFIYYFAFLSK
ncbi:hypothetical protein TVAG_045950 [Trichomonas vaginalis G3]|uniref:Uncharacterized protein n=1 Tax=Trichomonas vaginalis (strain ATCC PRA-98 / G3) TaxID=412133 RepID=A2DMG6_TRIV3|nr:hypothetical protein TVAGG3_0336880 [Trichomonas vaginalis G3]EAY18393.1 hypothetical protein TVAG_045950 [Trichomonas vaginalis G3]KAI5530336.1 hypothetical protein TVAGG3_0336880 [Trichomonas vaginalis G3]|eukprot:XP_001579379.1 hypothetical protein [Trichomonas vaginalis G3]